MPMQTPSSSDDRKPFVAPKLECLDDLMQATGVEVPPPVSS